MNEYMFSNFITTVSNILNIGWNNMYIPCKTQWHL